MNTPLLHKFVLRSCKNIEPLLFKMIPTYAYIESLFFV